MSKIFSIITDTGFSPAVIVVQAGLDVRWNIKNLASDSVSGTALLVPNFYTQLELNQGENLLYFAPDTDFEFSTRDNRFYGYIKVVNDLGQADIAAIKKEVSEFETLIYPPETFPPAGDGASCH